MNVLNKHWPLNGHCRSWKVLGAGRAANLDVPWVTLCNDRAACLIVQEQYWVFCKYRQLQDACRLKGETEIQWTGAWCRFAMHHTYAVLDTEDTKTDEQNNQNVIKTWPTKPKSGGRRRYHLILKIAPQKKKSVPVIEPVAESIELQNVRTRGTLRSV